MADYKLYQGDCLEIMQQIADKSVDCIICDPPFATTRNEWDKMINLEKMWDCYKRIIKDNGAIVLFSQLPFTADLVVSNREMFRYEWIWEKPNATGFLNANRMPMKAHDNILVFYKKLPTYTPQFEEDKPYVFKRNHDSSNYGKQIHTITVNDGYRYPTDVIKFSQEKGLHPTQKPVKLIEYLIRTYTNKGELVLDSCMGSGTTGVAAINEGRDFIGIELNKEYFEIAKKRIEEINAQIRMF